MLESIKNKDVSDLILVHLDAFDLDNSKVSDTEKRFVKSDKEVKSIEGGV